VKLVKSIDRSLARRALAVCFFGALGLMACSDPLTKRQDIADLRVLGARVEPLEDPSRAAVLAGESVRVRWLLAGPRGPLEVRYGLSACASAESARGIPSCTSEPSAEVVPDEPEREPSLELVVPEGPRLLMSGVFCTKGDVELEGSLESSSCVDASADQELASYEVPIAPSGATERDLNHHPDLTDAELLLDGELWPATRSESSAGAAGAGGGSNDESLANPCETDGAPRVAAGHTARFTLVLSETAREPRGSDQAFGALEVLQLSHVSTVGELERPFTVLEPTDTELVAKLTWKAPKSAGPAYFYFVVRDLRGGVSWLERGICVND
jgi:hypothetical protein